MLKQEEPVSLMYLYTRDGKTVSTPNVDIAIARNQDDQLIIVEKHIGQKVEKSTLIIEDKEL